jgi:hypothetical protein
MSESQTSSNRETESHGSVPKDSRVAFKIRFPGYFYLSSIKQFTAELPELAEKFILISSLRPLAFLR